MATITDIKTATQVAHDEAINSTAADSAETEIAANIGDKTEAKSAAPAPPREPISVPPDLYTRLKPILERVVAIRQRPLLLLISSLIDTETVTKLYEWRNELRAIGKAGPIDVLIASPGGELSACYTVARLLSRWTGHWHALIPSYAASGATLICLGSERLVMSEVAQLGPLDPQVISKRREKFFAVERQSPLEAFEAVKYLRKFSLESLDTTMKFLLERMITPQHALEAAAKFSAELAKPILDKIDPYDVGAFSLDSRVSMGYCSRVSHPADPDRKTQRGAQYGSLVEKYPTHEFVIDIQEATSLGFEVEQADGDLDQAFHEIRSEVPEGSGSDFECVGLVPATGKGATL